MYLVCCLPPALWGKLTTMASMLIFSSNSQHYMQTSTFQVSVYFFTVCHVTSTSPDGALSHSATLSMALILPLCLAVAAILVVLLSVLTRRRPKFQMKKFEIKPGTHKAQILMSMCLEGQCNNSRCNSLFQTEWQKWSLVSINIVCVLLFDIHVDIIKQHQESGTQEEVVLPKTRLTPPRLLLCYSSNDGPAHVKAVMQLGAFIQQHMATQVHSGCHTEDHLGDCVI